jgi:hypothetical protein
MSYGAEFCFPVWTTYLLTVWSRVLLEKLTGFVANQEILRILWNSKVHYRTHRRPFGIKNLNFKVYRIIILPVVLYGYETRLLTLRV